MNLKIKRFYINKKSSKLKTEEEDRIKNISGLNNLTLWNNDEVDEVLENSFKMTTRTFTFDIQNKLPNINISLESENFLHKKFNVNNIKGAIKNVLGGLENLFTRISTIAVGSFYSTSENDWGGLISSLGGAETFVDYIFAKGTISRGRVMYDQFVTGAKVYKNQDFPSGDINFQIMFNYNQYINPKKQLRAYFEDLFFILSLITPINAVNESEVETYIDNTLQNLEDEISEEQEETLDETKSNKYSTFLYGDNVLNNTKIKDLLEDENFYNKMKNYNYAYTGLRNFLVNNENKPLYEWFWGWKGIKLNPIKYETHTNTNLITGEVKLDKTNEILESFSREKNIKIRLKLINKIVECFNFLLNGKKLYDEEEIKNYNPGVSDHNELYNNNIDINNNINSTYLLTNTIDISIKEFETILYNILYNIDKKVFNDGDHWKIYYNLPVVYTNSKWKWALDVKIFSNDSNYKNIVNKTSRNELVKELFKIKRNIKQEETENKDSDKGILNKIGIKENNITTFEEMKNELNINTNQLSNVDIDNINNSNCLQPFFIPTSNTNSAQYNLNNNNIYKTSNINNNLIKNHFNYETTGNITNLVKENENDLIQNERLKNTTLPVQTNPDKIIKILYPNNKKNYNIYNIKEFYDFLDNLNENINILKFSNLSNKTTKEKIKRKYFNTSDINLGNSYLLVPFNYINNKNKKPITQKIFNILYEDVKEFTSNTSTTKPEDPENKKIIDQLENGGIFTNLFNKTTFTVPPILEVSFVDNENEEIQYINFREFFASNLSLEFSKNFYTYENGNYKMLIPSYFTANLTISPALQHPYEYIAKHFFNLNTENYVYNLSNRNTKESEAIKEKFDELNRKIEEGVNFLDIFNNELENNLSDIYMKPNDANRNTITSMYGKRNINGLDFHNGIDIDTNFSNKNNFQYIGEKYLEKLNQYNQIYIRNHNNYDEILDNILKPYRKENILNIYDYEVPILALDEGKIKKIVWKGENGGGLQLYFKPFNKKYTMIFVHLSPKINLLYKDKKDEILDLLNSTIGTTVTINKEVDKNEIIAIAGNTGYTNGPHIHLSLSDPDGEYKKEQKEKLKENNIKKEITGKYIHPLAELKCDNCYKWENCTSCEEEINYDYDKSVSFQNKIERHDVGEKYGTIYDNNTIVFGKIKNTGINPTS